MRASDDESARLLLEMLADDAPPPSRVDIAAVVKGGRRRVRYRRLVGVGAAAAVTVGALAVVPVVVDLATRARLGPSAVSPTAVGEAPPEQVPTAPTSCTPYQLPIPSSAVRSEVLGGDPTGRYLVGTASNDKGQSWVLRWDRGQLSVLDLPVSGPARLVVNSRGDVAGAGLPGKDEGGRMIAWVYRGDRFIELSSGSGMPVAVTGINERGDILGMIQTGPAASPGVPGPAASPGVPPLSSNDAEKLRAKLSEAQMQARAGGGLVTTDDLLPVVWPAEVPGTARKLTLPPGEGIVSVKAIDDDGTVVGTSTVNVPQDPVRAATPPSAVRRGLVWGPDGTVRELPTPPGYGPDTSVQAIRAGWVIGSYESPAQGMVVATRWNLRTGEVRPLPLRFVRSVNRYGWVTGYLIDGTGKLVPALAIDERTLVLATMKGFDWNKVPSIAVTISDNGQEIGSVLRSVKNGEDVAFHWTCG
jgi:hypothetical protein